MDFTPFLQEKNWTPLEREGHPTSYTRCVQAIDDIDVFLQHSLIPFCLRPMYGSEVLLQQTHRFMDG